MGASPRPAFLRGSWTPSMGKLGSRPIACLMALLSMPSIVVRCRSFKNPRCAAWYFEFRSCSTTSILYVGLIFLLDSTATSFQTSLVMYVWCSLKSSIVLMCISSILYDFLGGGGIGCVSRPEM